MPLSVPLWLGLSLRQRQKCRLIQPSWMTLDNLEEVKENEKQATEFKQLPDPHLFVKTQLIMDVGNSDLIKADEVRTIIKDIWDIRQSKVIIAFRAMIRLIQEFLFLFSLGKWWMLSYKVELFVPL